MSNKTSLFVSLFACKDVLGGTFPHNFGQRTNVVQYVLV